MPKSLNDIIPPSRRKAAGMDIPPTPRPAPVAPPPPQYEAPRARGRFPYLFVAIALVIIAGCVASLFFFSKSRVVVTPSSFSGPVTATFAATPSVGDLPYELIRVEKTASQSVPAETTETASDAAQGTVIISNRQDEPQQLIKNTRFETSSGLIFRIHEGVTVPAATASGPGTLSVTVYADEAGERHNIGPTSFTLPGLKASDAFELVTARSENSMEGGFSGERPSVTRATRDGYAAAMRETLETDLMSALIAEVPEGYVFIPGGTETEYEALPDTVEGAGTLAVRQKGVMTAVVFPNAALARAIAYEVSAAYSGEDVLVERPESLSLSAETGLPAANAESFDFSLSGTVHLAWQVDAAEIAGTVAGKTKDAAGTLLLGLPEVEESRLIVRPFWLRSFPEEPGKIEVEVVDPA